MAKHSFFVTGTDTDAGKTLVATGLLKAARHAGLSTAGLKPLAAGCEMTPQGLRNSDAVQLRALTTLDWVYEQVNPVALAAAIAPHIAADQERKLLRADRLAGFCRSGLRQAEFTLVEGAGGWRVPLNATETLSDLAKILHLPVILVVGVRLGCINHALLTAEAIRNDGLLLAGWVANLLDPTMPACDENIATLKARLAAPCLGVIPRLASPSPDAAAAYLDIRPLLT